MKQMVDSRLLNTNFHSTLFVQGVCIDWLRVLQSLVRSLLAFTAYHIARGKVNLSGTRNKTTTIIMLQNGANWEQRAQFTLHNCQRKCKQPKYVREVCQVHATSKVHSPVWGRGFHSGGLYMEISEQCTIHQVSSVQFIHVTGLGEMGS